MYPNQFDADSQVQYKTQRAMRAAERHRLARLAAGPDAIDRLHARLGVLRERTSAGLSASLAAMRGAMERMRGMRAGGREPREQCC